MALPAGACGGFIEDRAAESTLKILRGSQRAMRRSADIEIARSAAPGGLVQLESFAWAYPKHKQFARMHAEAQCQYAVGFAYDAWERSVLMQVESAGELEAKRERASRLLLRCSELSVALLGKNFAPVLEGTLPASALARAKKSDVAPLTWLAMSVANRIALAPLAPTSLAQLPIAKALLRRSRELDESFDGAIANTLSGALASSVPSLLGGDPKRGAEFFERARMLSQGSALMNEVIYARTYAVTQRDRALFRTILTRVKAATLDAWPENMLANTMAQDKAQLYLQYEDRIFGDRP